MILKVNRGRRIQGLCWYLASEGRHDEHTNQHVVAASEGLEEYVGVELDNETTYRLAAELDAPRELAGINPADGKRGYVYHVSIALPEEDRALTEAEWTEVAHDMLSRLELAGPNVESRCRWALVHHGESKGRDHTHLVVDLVRENGELARPHNDFDYDKLSKCAAEAEARYGLTRCAGRAGRGAQQIAQADIHRVERTARRLGHEAAEELGVDQRDAEAVKQLGDQRAKQLGVDQPVPTLLTRKVRAVAAASANEAEFVAGLRATWVPSLIDGKRERLKVRPRYAKGGTDKVDGYSVGWPGDLTAAGDQLYRGGRRLDEELSLPNLRQRWADTTAERDAAVARWGGRIPAHEPTRAQGKRNSREWRQAADNTGRAQFQASRQRWRSPQWAGTYRDLAGITAALEGQLGDGRLRRAEQLFATEGRQPAGEARLPASDPTRTLLTGVAVAVAQAALPDRDAWLGTVMLLGQLTAAAKAVGDARRAGGYADLARREADRTEHELYRLRQELNDRTRDLDLSGDSLAPDYDVDLDLDLGGGQERDDGLER